MIETLLAPLLWLLSLVWSILMWIVGTVLWLVVWLLLPVAIVAFLAFRLAEKVLGPDAVRAFVKRHTLRYGAATWNGARRLMFALSALPLRVMFWFAVYAVRHAVVSLFWRPKWTPWQRAWGRRWKPVKRTRSGRVIKDEKSKAATVRAGTPAPSSATPEPIKSNPATKA